MFPSLAGRLISADFDTRQHEVGISVDGIRTFEEHAIRRRPWTQAMSVSAVNYYTDAMKDKILELLEVFQQHEGAPIDLAYWLNLFGCVGFERTTARALTRG